jgi:hypothetical protein
VDRLDSAVHTHRYYKRMIEYGSAGENYVNSGVPRLFLRSPTIFGIVLLTADLLQV